MLTPCVTYVRVSSEEQAKVGFSIPFQREKVEEYCAENGFEVVAHFEDVETAKQSGRTGFGKLVAFLRTKAVRDVVVHRVDRGFRNYSDYGLLIEQLRVRVHSVHEPSSDSAVGRMVQGMSVVVAKYHVDNLSDEVKKGIRERFETGRCVTKAPVGYKNISRTRTEMAKVEVDETMAPVVVGMFERYARGTVSLDELAEDMYDAGLRTRKNAPLTGERVRRILKHPFYKGLVLYRGEVRPGIHPAIVPTALWERVQTVLALRHRDPGDHGRFFLLRGILTCARCGRRLTAEDHPRGSYYRCQSDGITACNAPYSRVAELDADVEQLLGRVSLSAGAKGEIEAILTAFEAERDERRGRDEQRLRTELSAAEAKLVSVTDKYVTNRIPEEAYTPLRRGYEADRVRIAGELEALTDDITLDIAEFRRILATAGSLAAIYRRAQTPESRKALLKQVFRCIVVDNAEITRIEFNPPFDVLLETPHGASGSDAMVRALLDYLVERRRAAMSPCSITT